MAIATENKAKLTMLGADGSPIGAPIPVQFNPEKYSKSWGLTWQEVGKTLQWTKTTPGDFTVTMKFDTYEEGKEVTSMTTKVREMLDPSAGQKPMGCLFQWGKVVYKGVVKSVTENYTLFLADGTPVRSELTLILQPWPGELQLPQ
jgi:hypothetical protein